MSLKPIQNPTNITELSGKQFISNVGSVSPVVEGDAYYVDGQLCCLKNGAFFLPNESWALVSK